MLRHVQNGSYGDVFSMRDKQTGFTCAAKRVRSPQPLTWMIFLEGVYIPLLIYYSLTAHLVAFQLLLISVCLILIGQKVTRQVTGFY